MSERAADLALVLETIGANAPVPTCCSRSYLRAVTVVLLSEPAGQASLTGTVLVPRLEGRMRDWTGLLAVGAWVSGPATVKVRVAGVGSALPAWSIAWTLKLCSPSERLE